MIEEVERARTAIETTHLTELAGLAKGPTQRLDPSRRAATRKTLPEVKASLAESGDARAEGKRSNLDVLNCCVCLLEAAGDSQARNSAGAGGTAELFFFDGSDDGSFVHQDSGRIAAKGPDAEGKHRLSVPLFSSSFEEKQAQNRTWKPGLEERFSRS